MSERRGADGRRRYEPDWPKNSPRNRRTLGRLMLVLGAMVVLLSLGGSLLFDGESEGNEPSAPPTPTAAGGSSGTAAAGAREYPDEWYRVDLESPDLVPVAVLEVIDGDTLEVEAGGTTLRVRAYGFDTPERGERCYEESVDRLDQLVDDRVLLLADERLEDPGGRQLRYLYTPEGLLIDAVMVAEGYAEAWRADGSLRSMLGDLESTAREERAGCLWSD